MEALHFRKPYLFVLIVQIIVVNALAMVVGYSTRFHNFSGEDGPLEIFQTLLLAIAAAAFFILFLRVRHGARLVASGAASLCVLALFRELQVPAWIPVLHFMASSPAFLRFLAVVLGLHMLIQFYLNREHIPAFLGWFVRLEWWPFLFAGVLLLAADAFEKIDMQTTEEILELNGYITIATAAGMALFRLRNLRE